MKCSCLLALLFGLSFTSWANAGVNLPQRCWVRFVSVAEGAEILSHKDEFIQRSDGIQTTSFTQRKFWPITLAC